MKLLAHASRIRQALQLRWELRSVEHATSCWPVEARGDEQLASVVLHRNGRLNKVDCDYLACSFGLVSNTELAEMLGCATANGSVVVDETQQTSVPDVFCAGEATGVGGWELAEAEGARAGYAAAGQLARATRAPSRRFAEALARAFTLRPELKALPDAETLICRCEDVAWSRLRDLDGWREAKLQTRCGMGPCQGRVCGPSLRFLKGWTPTSVRTPLSPVPLRHLVGENRRS
jgi:NADPH-dependent 2,4-dienoyl-CoA reductase/sulfur reductase-like enzyme